MLDHPLSVNVALQELLDPVVVPIQDHDRAWKLHCQTGVHGAQDGDAINNPLNVHPLHKLPVDG